MKVAIFHNFMDNIGGAERVALTLAREISADIYTTNINKKHIAHMGFSDVLGKIYSIGKVPIQAPLRQQIALWRFGRLRLGEKYDFYIIDGDWAVSGARHNKPNLWYVHSPIREIWDLYSHTRQHTVPWTLRPIFDAWVWYNRHLNKKHADQVEIIVCNSQNTRKRVKKFLEKEVKVIYPPIDTKSFIFKKPESYWLSVNRLISHKRVDMQLKAFNNMPQEKLIVVGSYENSRHFLRYARYCNEIKPNNVEIKSWVSQKELVDLYASCKGLIATSKDEDFGMNAVEAMASGKPVIAPNEGGYKETIISGKTGILIDDINEEKLIEAVKSSKDLFGKNPEKVKKDCQERAMNFDKDTFIRKIKSTILA
jgi:glycosyltransferase involved in cell wall biosynthesis